MEKKLIDRTDLDGELIAKELMIDLDDGSDGEPDEVVEIDLLEVLGVAKDE